MPVPMTAIARQTYNKVALNAGDPFEAESEAEAADMVAIHMAVRQTKPPVVTSALHAEEPSAKLEESTSPPTEIKHSEFAGSGKAYSRRDMRPNRR